MRLLKKSGSEGLYFWRAREERNSATSREVQTEMREGKCEEESERGRVSGWELLG